MTINRGLTLMCLLACLHRPAFGQASASPPPPAIPQPPAAKPAFTEEQAAAWDAQARTVAARLELNDNAAEVLRTLYRTVRERHARFLEEAKKEWYAYVADELEKGRRGEQFDQGVLSRQALDRDLANTTQVQRRKLAEAIVEKFDKEIAEKIYPLLGALDEKVDGAVTVLLGFELEEKAAKEATLLVLDHYVRAAEAREKAGRNAEARAQALRAINSETMTAFAAMLSEDQRTQVARALGLVRRSEPVEEDGG